MFVKAQIATVMSQTAYGLLWKLYAKSKQYLLGMSLKELPPPGFSSACLTDQKQENTSHVW